MRVEVQTPSVSGRREESPPNLLTDPRFPRGPVGRVCCLSNSTLCTHRGRIFSYIRAPSMSPKDGKTGRTGWKPFGVQGLSKRHRGLPV